jgi:hypothetical protein
MISKWIVKEHLTNDSSVYECLQNLRLNLTSMPGAKRALEVGELNKCNFSRAANTLAGIVPVVFSISGRACEPPTGANCRQSQGQQLPKPLR